MSRSAHKELSWLMLINSSSTPSQDWHYLYDDPIRITGDLDRRKLHVRSVNNSLDPLVKQSSDHSVSRSFHGDTA